MLTPYYQDESVTLWCGDCVELLADEVLPDAHLTVTSPPYADLIDYEGGATFGQIGSLSFDDWRAVMFEVMRGLFDLTTPGGRAVVNVGDVCVSRKAVGRHLVHPLGAALTISAVEGGWDYLTPIRWEKVANITMEASTSSGVLGKPNQPGGVIKNDSEAILLFRKGGTYRKPTAQQIESAHIASVDYRVMFRGTWRDIAGTSDPRHPAPFPLAIPSRLIRMFSFPGDTVLDPFAGTGTTLVAAKKLGRKGVGVELEERYCELAAQRLSQDVLDFGDAA